MVSDQKPRICMHDDTSYNDTGKLRHHPLPQLEAPRGNKNHLPNEQFKNIHGRSFIFESQNTFARSGPPCSRSIQRSIDFAEHIGATDNRSIAKRFVLMISSFRSSSRCSGWSCKQNKIMSTEEACVLVLRSHLRFLAEHQGDHSLVEQQ